jgi:hypothetical protein
MRILEFSSHRLCGVGVLGDSRAGIAVAGPGTIRFRDVHGEALDKCADTLLGQNQQN